MEMVHYCIVGNSHILSFKQALSRSFYIVLQGTLQHVCENCHLWSLCIHLMSFLLLIVKTCDNVPQVKRIAIGMLLFFSLAQFLIF